MVRKPRTDETLHDGCRDARERAAPSYIAAGWLIVAVVVGIGTLASSAAPPQGAPKVAEAARAAAPRPAAAPGRCDPLDVSCRHEAPVRVICWERHAGGRWPAS
jgi:hypothetical protein